MKKTLLNNNVIKQVITIFFIEIGSSAAFAVLFSGLSLYLTQQKIYSEQHATLITGLFLSLNYFLPFIGGALSNYLISCKNLFCLGLVLSLIGCYLLAFDINLYLGLSLFLMSSLVTNVCLKMFITYLFEAGQIKQRRIAFMWSYIGMNAGFLIGFFISGYSSNRNSYTNLFIFIGILLAISALLALFYIDDAKKRKNSVLNQIILTMGLLTIVVLFLNALFSFAEFIEKYITLLLVLGMLFYLYLGFKKTKPTEKINFIKFIGFSLLAIIFWSLYMLTPIAFMQLINNDVEKNVFGFDFAPQWFLNADSIIILIIGPVIAVLMSQAKSKFNYNFRNINYFLLAFSICVIAFLVLLNGLHQTSNLKIPAWSMLGCLVFLAIGETFISPTGNSLIGELIPESLREMMIGYWSMNIGVGILLATYISNMMLLPYINKNGLIPDNLVKLEQNITIICFAISALFLSVLIFNQVVKRLMIMGNRYKNLESKI